MAHLPSGAERRASEQHSEPLYELPKPKRLKFRFSAFLRSGVGASLPLFTIAVIVFPTKAEQSVASIIVSIAYAFIAVLIFFVSLLRAIVVERPLPNYGARFVTGVLLAAFLALTALPFAFLQSGLSSFDLVPCFDRDGKWDHPRIEDLHTGIVFPGSGTEPVCRNR